MENKRAQFGTPMSVTRPDNWVPQVKLTNSVPMNEGSGDGGFGADGETQLKEVTDLLFERRRRHAG